MAIFDSPNTPDPVPHGEQRAPLTSSPYAALEHHELLQLIDELAEERARARFREGIWIAFFAHLIFFVLLYFAPRFLFKSPHVIDPMDAIRNHEKAITIDPNVLRELNHSTPPPKANRPLNQQAIQQIQKMQQSAQAEAAARALQQQQQPRQQPQQQQPQQQANTQTPPPPQTPPVENPRAPLPEAPKQQANALPEMPSPQQHQQASSANDAFNNIIKQQAHNAAQNAMHGGSKTYSGGANVAPGSHGVGAGMAILTDTQGVDFDPYMQRLKFIIERAWQPLIPESVYPPLLKQGVVGIRFTIAKDGHLLTKPVLETPSGDVALDKAAWGAIIGPQPFPPLPKEFPGPSLEIRGGFFYNIPPQQ
jgi:TonB family protein